MIICIAALLTRSLARIDFVSIHGTIFNREALLPKVV